MKTLGNLLVTKEIEKIKHPPQGGFFVAKILPTSIYKEKKVYLIYYSIFLDFCQALFINK